MEYGLSFGSNLGDRVAHLRAAKARVLATRDASLLAASSLYETEPVGVREQYVDMKFVNAVLIIESDESAEDWLGWLNEIETALGRVRGEDKNAPRPVDIDILYAGDQCIGSRGEEAELAGSLIVPHPRWAQRRFVLQPLAEVRGDLVLPNQKQTVAELLEALAEDDPLRTLDEAW